MGKKKINIKEWPVYCPICDKVWTLKADFLMKNNIIDGHQMMFCIAEKGGYVHPLSEMAEARLKLTRKSK